MVTTCRACNEEIKHEQDGIRFWSEDGEVEDYCATCIAQSVQNLSLFTNAELESMLKQPLMGPSSGLFIH